MKKYELPALPYAYDALEPVISKQIMTLHHDKHHAAYVNGANVALGKLDAARREGKEIDIKATLRDLSFNASGHVMHSIFWENMAPVGKGGAAPTGALSEKINEDFGSFEAFKKEFAAAAKAVEGSGWAALVKDRMSDQLLVLQIEKHNLLSLPRQSTLLVLDVWEHAYYPQYLNDRAKYVDSFWDIVNWKGISEKFENCCGRKK